MYVFMSRFFILRLLILCSLNCLIFVGSGIAKALIPCPRFTVQNLALHSGTISLEKLLYSAVAVCVVTPEQFISDHSKDKWLNSCGK